MACPAIVLTVPGGAGTAGLQLTQASCGQSFTFTPVPPTPGWCSCRARARPAGSGAWPGSPAAPSGTKTFSWETVGGAVNEGAKVLQHGGKTFIVFSASHCSTPDYKLGILTYTPVDAAAPETSMTTSILL